MDSQGAAAGVNRSMFCGVLRLEESQESKMLSTGVPEQEVGIHTSEHFG